MLTVMVGWILFRAETFTQARVFVTRMFSFSEGIHWVHPHAIVAVVCLVFASLSIKGKCLSGIRDVRTPSGLFVVLTLFLLSVLYPAAGSSPFIYFQF